MEYFFINSLTFFLFGQERFHITQSLSILCKFGCKFCTKIWQGKCKRVDCYMLWTSVLLSYSKTLSNTASRSIDFENTRFQILPKITLIIIVWDKTSKIYSFKRFSNNLKIYRFFELPLLISDQNQSVPQGLAVLLLSLLRLVLRVVLRMNKVTSIFKDHRF